ncbi:hypothetical protein NDU88_001348 [Pleurodeles waltl]|uniref:Uncharacterized protein n=1 Tax=Pleurodeles waltl TaxID=8319 RepID=A0AAV7VB49_PLEWA|nr:hypothetical protein NDU88_001348 [Pleurodeles waltl]
MKVSPAEMPGLSLFIDPQTAYLTRVSAIHDLARGGSDEVDSTSSARNLIISEESRGAERGGRIREGVQ